MISRWVGTGFILLLSTPSFVSPCATTVLYKQNIHPRLHEHSRHLAAGPSHVEIVAITLERHAASQIDDHRGSFALRCLLFPDITAMHVVECFTVLLLRGRARVHGVAVPGGRL